jgi:hypothetical protein
MTACNSARKPPVPRAAFSVAPRGAAKPTASKKDENELLQLKGQVLQLTLQLTNEQAARINSEGENKDLQEKLQKTMEEVAAIKNSAGDASQLKTVADRLFAEMEHARTRRKSADFAALEQKIETALSVAEEKTRLTFEVSNLNAQIRSCRKSWTWPSSSAMTPISRAKSFATLWTTPRLRLTRRRRLFLARYLSWSRRSLLSTRFSEKRKSC